MRRSAQFLAGFAVVWLAQASASAAPATACGHGAGPALGELACELAQSLGARAGGALVVGIPPSGGRGAAPRPELGSRLATLVAGALGSTATPWAKAEPEGRVLALPWQRRPLVLVSARIEGDRLAVSADFFASYPGLWQRAKGKLPGPAAHGFAERGIDAEVRSYLPRIPLVVSRVERAGGSDPDTVAIACGDVDADGSIEIAALGRRRLLLGRLRGGRFEAFREKALAELVPIAPAPFREPVASAWIPEPGTLEIGSTDRARALRLGPALEPKGELGARLPWPGGGCAEADGVLLAFAPVACATRRREDASARAHERFPGASGPPPGIDAIAGAVLLSGGERRRVRARRRAEDGAVLMSDERGAVVLASAGAQLAVGDLDGDGNPELAASLDTLDPKTDAVAVYSWPPGGALTERFRVPVPSGVRALATCPPRLDRMAEIVVATGDGVWVVE